MKKVFVIGVALIFALGAAGALGLAYAQAQTPPPPVDPDDTTTPYGGFGGRGMMGGRGFTDRMMGRVGVDGQGIMHDEMVAAMADALDLTPDELNTRLAGGETMWQIAEDQGITLEEFREVMFEARASALAQAVEDGSITQEQAEWMNQRMSQMQEGGFGPGTCTGEGPNGRGMHRGGRWNN